LRNVKSRFDCSCWQVRQCGLLIWSKCFAILGIEVSRERSWIALGFHDTWNPNALRRVGPGS
jgi:hypothetical protein